MAIFNIISLLAGLVFFLFGMSTMSNSLEKLAGSKLEIVLKKMTDKPVVGLLMGLVVTAVIQSSSATTVILVGLVNSGLMSFQSTIGVLFGANIGTTVTAWLLSLSSIGGEGAPFILQLFKPQIFSPVLAVIGTAFTMMAKSDKKKIIGTLFIGFTVLIYGMDIMSDAVESLSGIGDLFAKFNNPVLCVLIGILVTAVIQSSSASVGILQALSLTGVITYDIAVPIILGQNIGTCITGIISSIGAGAKAKRVVFSQIFIKILGMLIVLPVYVIGTKALNLATDELTVNPVSIAIIHTIYNVILLFLMPFSKAIAKLCEKVIREKKADEVGKQAKSVVYLDERLLRSPAVAVMECDNYTSQMAIVANVTILKALNLVFDYNREDAELIKENEGILDTYEDELGSYLVKISAEALSANDARTVSRMLHTIGDFERLGDHALNLKKVAQEIHQKKISFSESAQKEITTLIEAITEIVVMTTKVYEKNDVALASRVEPLEQVIDRLTAEIKSHHINRLQSGDCTIEIGFVLSDLLTNCERISDHCSNIAVAIIEAQDDGFDPHNYLNKIKYNNEEFKAVFEEYNGKYDLHK